MKTMETRAKVLTSILAISFCAMVFFVFFQSAIHPGDYAAAVIFVAAFIGVVFLLKKQSKPEKEKPGIKTVVRGLGFFALWFLGGGAVVMLTMSFFLLTLIGGVSEPPAIWSSTRDLGSVVLPLLLPLGGVPAAIQIMRGHPWKRAAVIAFVICASTWLVIMFVIIFGPSIFGWWW